ncbi:Enoyl-CoA hydratase/carnithine racemase [Actinokineospora alba]|uniref:Enoyl-CoA hydratase/carnithine racemase n=1 Tax=Actinokineospora alba TaxID=504798 RepID=A0A1H0NHJ2_9PSEU|nr:enoyl-CoA hydratase-related protein [Actinokineospora alba]TDP68720.1 enoyl-CoA hydratase/carnithine racemase [Actinokineospora alba]SDH85204.1 Enoyl-CoA hydratase/carnithine racemase [Actinokineospora alba]SDO92066.1 Enoyl-CoA hydratase/carnithine racemase [Actinokineospora alba]
MTFEAITYAVEDGIATITLNRPAARNGYTIRMANELPEAFAAADADDDVRVVVINANGKDFCVGMDLTEGGDDFTAADWVEPASRATRPLSRMNKPVIAAIHGAAVGVGSTLTLPADIRIAASDARFGFVFARRGLFPEGGSTWFLPRIVGLARAQEWMLTGRLIPATEALAAGLVSQVVEPEALLDKAYEIARDLIANTAPVATAVIRRTLLHMQGEDSPEAAFQLDSKLIAHAFASPDSLEGITAFLQKRAPKFPGTVPADLPAFLPWRAPVSQAD